MTIGKTRFLGGVLATLAPAALLTSVPFVAHAGFCDSFGCTPGTLDPNNPGPRPSIPGPSPAPSCPKVSPAAPAPADSDPDESGPDSNYLKAEMSALSAILKEEWTTDAARRAETQRTSYPCYVAFIHGSGVNDDMYRGPSYSTEWHSTSRNLPKPYDVYAGCPNRGDEESQEAYWVPKDRSENDSLTFRAGRQHWEEGERCMVWRVAYDGVNRTFAESAMQAAVELTNFINRYNIPSKKLTIVTHSMGGLVARFILNNAAPTSPYPNGYFGTVASRTKAVITIQAPHAGSMVADAVYGEADHAWGNVVGGVAQAFGVASSQKSRARQSMRRVYVERAAGNGGWLADFTRTTPLYLIAGRDVRPDQGGNGSLDDHLLKSVSDAQCYTEGVVNNGGSLCSPGGIAASAACLLWGPAAPICLAALAAASSANDIPNDGLVETDSALGLYLRDNPAAGITKGISRMQGAAVPWAIVQHNHNHGRWDLISREINVIRADGHTTQLHGWLGTFIGDYGLDL